MGTDTWIAVGALLLACIWVGRGWWLISRRRRKKPSGPFSVPEMKKYIDRHQNGQHKKAGNG